MTGNILPRGIFLTVLFTLSTLLMWAAYAPADASAGNQMYRGEKLRQATSPSAFDSDILRSLFSGSTPNSSGASRARPRIWFMPEGTARREARLYADAVYFRSAPGDFMDPEEPGMYTWDDRGTGRCYRQSKSFVYCYTFVAAEFDIVDEFGGYLYSDTYLCDWFTEAWYPRASSKRLRTDVAQAECVWLSEL